MEQFFSKKSALIVKHIFVRGYTYKQTSTLYSLGRSFYPSHNINYLYNETNDWVS